MSKKQFKSQASSTRAGAGAFSGSSELLGGSLPSRVFGAGPSSMLSYVYEPPDLTDVDPKLAVIYKSLQKKDSTTKVKALEDLKAFASSPDFDFENQVARDGLLEPWIKLYPRTSIDTSQRVRQLAHTFQGQVSVRCGKRIAKSLPQSIGAWVCGQYDSDRGVARSASEALKQLFPTEEKLASVWRVYLLDILDFCNDAITKETVQTLSDERVTSPDEAIGKYARVVSSAIVALQHILRDMQEESLEKGMSIIEGLLRDKHLWKLAADSELLIRRSMYRLLGTSLQHWKQTLDMSVLSRHIITSGLRMDQTGCENDFMFALSLLTSTCPAVWTELYSGKKTTKASLTSYLRKANPGMQPTYWSLLSDLLQTVPPELLKAHDPEPRQEATEEAKSKPMAYPILEALRDCISRQARLRADQGPAWLAYLGATDRSLELVEDKKAKQVLLLDHVLPLVSQYVMTPADLTSRGAAVPDGLETSVKAFQQVMEHMPSFATERWQSLSAAVIEAIQISLPEQAKDYKKSQDGLGAMLQRWYNLFFEVSRIKPEDTNTDTYGTILAREVQVMFDALESRNGKPYGAAIGLASLMSYQPSGTNIARSIQQNIFNFLRKNMAALIASPSSVYLVEMLPKFQSHFDLRPLYLTTLQGLSGNSSAAAKAAEDQLLRSDNLCSCIEIEELRGLLGRKLREAVDGNDRDWDLVNTTLAKSGLIKELRGNVISIIINGMQAEKTRKSSLKGLGRLTEHYESLFEDDKDNAGDYRSILEGLLLELLQISESSDEEDGQSARNTLIHLTKNASKACLLAVAKVISSIVTTEERAPSIKTLVNTAHNILSIYAKAGYDMEEMLSMLLPTRAQWSELLNKHVDRRPKVGIAVNGTLDILYLSENSNKTLVPGTSRTAIEDKTNVLILLRMITFAMYLIKLDLFRDHCGQRTLTVVLQDILISQAIIETYRQAGFPDTLEVVGFEASDLRELEVHSDAISCIDAVGEQVLIDAQTRLAASSQGYDTASYYNAQAYSFLTHYGSGLDDDPEKMKSLRKSPYIFYSTQVLKGWKDESTLLKLCNELLADLTGIDIVEQQAHSLSLMAMLDAMLRYGYRDKLLEQIPRQRLVFFVKHLVKQARIQALSRNLKASVTRVLLPVLPSLKDLYESFWEDLIAFLVESWQSVGEVSDDFALILHTNVELYRKLRSLTGDLACNDDLKDALSADAKTLDELVILLLPKLAEKSANIIYWKIVQGDAALLGVDISAPPNQDFGPLYSVFSRSSTVLQQAVYTILHRSIIAGQEENSMEKALTKDYVAQLPEELLSVVLTAPDPDTRVTSEESGNSSLENQGYLLSWMLIFANWTNSSQRVQEDYISIIDKGSYLPTLLAFTTDYLVDGRNQLPSASKYDITIYNPSVHQTQFPVEHCLSHLYYLSLRYLPTLVRSWWQDTAPRQTKTILEAWTEKYFTASVVADEFSTIANSWIPTLAQEESSADHPLEVRTSPSAQEITAAIPIDETTMRIAIRLPASYPLTRPTVETIRRVGVDEKKWRTWNLNSQGVMNFSRVGGSGAIIDALNAWKKNVTARLKGQSECAICYSVVSADKQLPSKKCSTCGNFFHGNCLFRWFKSSNSSSCPLCRNAFNYA